MDTYTKLPSKPQKEFWNQQRIEHIRQLSSTGRPAYLWMEDGLTDRILDRVSFAGVNVAESNKRVRNLTDFSMNEIDTSVDLAYGRIKLSTPLYLGDMSFGALSGIPNIALAKAADITGVLTGTGEGGLHEEVRRCKRITVQWASARFGVDIGVLNTGLGIVIKIGQGAKPGIGGHLPGQKVTDLISVTRRIPIGKDAISPAPHHDIYSIEDLGQRIWALKEATGKPVFVKVGVTNYIPYIASGIARMGADGIIMDGQGAGTGAAPLIVKDNVGMPIDIAVASVDRILRQQNMRKGFSVIAAGMVGSAEDTAKLMALGADCVSIGTASLLALGCLMVHKCHLGFCPALLTNKISPNPTKVLSQEKAIEWVVNLIRGWDAELKLILKELRLSNIRELIGRHDLLQGHRMNHETLELLGVKSAEGFVANLESWFGMGFKMPENENGFWSQNRRSHLQELAGTIGKTGGEAVISSMGTIGAPFVETPMTICDWLRSDGAQVTRPSIDPYREEIETSIHLARSRIRIYAPVIFSPLPEEIPDNVRKVFAQVACSMGTVMDFGSAQVPEDATKYLKCLFIQPANHFELGDKLSEAAAMIVTEDKQGRPLKEEVEAARKLGKPIYIKLASTEETIAKAGEVGRLGIDGIIVDWDLKNGEDRLDLEITTSEVDRALSREFSKGAPLRSQLDLIVEGGRVRGADDVYKLAGLGADAVGLSKAALIAIGYEGRSVSKFNAVKAREALENVLFGFQREIKLLAGAAGVSSLHSSLVRNRELFRSVDLDPEIRHRLGVKPAGMG